MKEIENPWLRIIGDVHGKQNEYTFIANEATHSIQLGDMGFNYDWVKSILSSDNHKIVGGNHDNYTIVEGKFVEQTPHFLGDFGIHSIPEFGDIFYVRGGQSIDKKYRKEGVDWWPEEEITYAQGIEALELYSKIKPDFMISHECPVGIIDHVGMPKEQALRWDIRPSMTAILLQSMLEIHSPKIWCHGHHHKSKFIIHGQTTFISLGELAFIDFHKNFLEEPNVELLFINDVKEKVKICI